MRRYSIGIDPGKSAAIAVVEYRGIPGRRLVYSASIYGGAGPRENRLQDSLRDVARIIGVKRDAVGGIIDRPYADVWIELPAGGGASAGRANGWQLSVGRDIGRWEALANVHFGVIARTIAANSWPKMCGIRCGKSRLDGGFHRVQEARLRLGDSSDLAAGVTQDTAASRERRIARAEAALIAYAGSK